MRIGMFTSGYSYRTLEQAFADARAFGYDFIELWGGRPHAYAPDLTAGEIERIRSLIDKYGMPVRVFTPEHNAYPYNYMLGSEKQRLDSLSYLMLAMDAGKALSAEYMLISVGHASDVVTQKEKHVRLAASVRFLAAHAEKSGMKLLIEPLTPMESNACTTAAELAEVLGEVNSPNLFGMCDIVVPFVQGELPILYQRLLGDRLRHLHIVDSDGKTEAHILPGDGIMPIANFVADFIREGYNGDATIELVSAYMNDPSYYSKLAIDRFRAIMERETI